MVNRTEVVAAHRELVEASDGVRHLLVVEDLTAEKIKAARSRLAGLRARHRGRRRDGLRLRPRSPFQPRLRRRRNPSRVIVRSRGSGALR